MNKKEPNLKATICPHCGKTVFTELNDNSSQFQPSKDSDKRFPLKKYLQMLRVSQGDVAIQQIKSDITGLPYTQVISGELFISLSDKKDE
jgi:hypothetical protein